MNTRQVFKPTDKRYGEFAIQGADLAAPLPDTGDIIQWIAKGTTFSARVQSKTFSYDKDEISLARTGDWGLTIVITVDVVEVS